MDFLKESFQTIIAAIILTLFIYYFISTPNQVNGLSMYPNILPDELILTNRVKHHLGDTGIGENWGWNYERGQVIIFKQAGKDAFIKRVIGLPGDEVYINDGQIVVNGQKLDESYISEEIPTQPGSFLREDRVVTIPEGNYLVFGDNRTESLDSRDVSVGYVERGDIIGPAELRLLPLSKIGVIEIGEIVENPVEEENSEN